MARPGGRGGRVNKASSQPIRRTQPRPPLGRFVQSQISIWANQARPGPGLQVNEGGQQAPQGVQQAPPLEVAPAQQTLAPPPMTGREWSRSFLPPVIIQ